ncbi:MAG: hypothetical protein HY721_21420 [Planctomycetes bacterium]|nr:hypothetical protein [Planctomycetota bacterium]
MRIGLVCTALVLGGAAPGTSAASPASAAKKGYELKPLKETPPAEVAEKVREAVAPEGVRVVDPKGEPFADVWLRKSVPTQEAKQELGVKFGQVPEGTVLGVVRFHQKSSDFKGNAFPAGTYTVRLALQPVDGDHQGVSDTRDFVLLAPAKVDDKLDPLPTKEAVKLSVQVSGIKHPTTLYLVKPLDEDAKLPRLVEDEDLARWTLECEAPAEKGGATVRLGIVLVGKAAEL